MGIKGWIRFYNVGNTMRTFQTNLSLMAQCNKIICERKKEPRCLLYHGYV